MMRICHAMEQSGEGVTGLERMDIVKPLTGWYSDKVRASQPYRPLPQLAITNRISIQHFMIGLQLKTTDVYSK